MNPALRAVLLSRPSSTRSAVIAALFGSGDGAIYEFGDLSSVYQESSGTTAGAVGQAAGLVLDERYARGSELVTNGGFADATGWSDIAGGTVSSFTGGQCSFTISASFRGVYQTYALPANKFYEVTATVVALSAGQVEIVGKSINDGISGTTTFTATRASTGTLSAIVFCSGLTASIAVRNSTSGTTTTIDNISIREISGNHASQSVSASRPIETAYSGYTAALFDGTDDGLASPIGGGGTTGFFWCGSVRVIGGDGTARSVWSDVGTNTGYRVRIASTNKLALGAGNGSAYTSATTTDDVLAGNTYVLTVWDDGTNLNAQVNRGTVASVARPSVSAGSSGFSIGKDHNAASAFANIAIFALVYKMNGGVSDKDRLRAQRYCASKAGISI